MNKLIPKKQNANGPITLRDDVVGQVKYTKRDNTQGIGNLTKSGDIELEDGRVSKAPATEDGKAVVSVGTRISPDEKRRRDAFRSMTGFDPWSDKNGNSTTAKGMSQDEYDGTYNYRSAYDGKTIWEPMHLGLLLAGKGVGHVIDFFVDGSLGPLNPDYLTGNSSEAVRDKVKQNAQLSVATASTVASPSKWIGTFRGQGAPWDINNTGLGDDYTNEMFDMVTTPFIAKGINSMGGNYSNLLKTAGRNKVRALRGRINSARGVYKEINPIDYIGTLNPMQVEKFLRINARQATPGLVVKTIASDGVEETVNTASAGDWIVNNVDTPDNLWIITGKNFAKKYVPESNGVYKPAGGPMNSYELLEPVTFTAPWGEKMNIQRGGYLLLDPSNLTDIYGISGKDFRSTYKYK